MNACFVDEDGKEKPFIMGCYGIGVSRLVASVVEAHHDDKGVIWPLELAPFGVVIVLVNPRDEAQAAVAQDLYDQLTQAGVEVLLDDRDERPGVKFNDADLTGIPIQIVVGKRVTEGAVEMRRRGVEGQDVVPAADAVQRAQALLAGNE
jgi:prolyl-tRNA synthetase